MKAIFLVIPIILALIFLGLWLGKVGCNKCSSICPSGQTCQASGTTPASTCPTGQTCQITGSSTSSFPILKSGTDFSNVATKASPVTKESFGVPLANCVSTCKNDVNCQAFAFSPTADGMFNCYFKNSSTTPISNLNSNAFIVK